MDELKRAYRSAMIIGISMIATLFLYALFVETTEPRDSSLENFLEGFSRDSVLVVLRYILYGFSITLLFVIKFLRNRFLSTKKIGSLQMEKFFKFFPDFLLIKLMGRFFLEKESNTQRSSEGKASSLHVQKLLNTAIITYVFCEVPTLYGLVLFFIGKDRFDFYILSCFSLISFAVYFPRYHQWEEWIKTVNV